jgi:hypothetical protein
VEQALETFYDMGAMYEKNFLENYTKTKLYLREIDYDENFPEYYKKYK